MPARSEMPLGPLQRYITRKVAIYGQSAAAAIIGVDESRVRRVMRGEDYSKGKVRATHGVTLDLVDRWVTAFGDHYLELYPEMLDDVVLDADYLAVAA